MNQTTSTNTAANGDATRSSDFTPPPNKEDRENERAAADRSVETALSEDAPDFHIPAAETVSGFESEQDVKRWATNLAMSNAKLTRWDADGQSAIDSLTPDKQQLVAKRNKINGQIATEPDTIREAVRQDDYDGIGITPIFISRTRYYIGSGIACSLLVAGYVLNTEFAFATAAAMSSPWGFAQSVEGARGLVFAGTFGSFLSLTGWSAVEKYRVHWSVLLVGRVGAVLSVAASSVITFALGSTFLDEGSYFGWPMLMIPLGSGTLICGAFLAKEFGIWVGRMAFPMHSVANVKLNELGEKLEVVEARLRQILQNETKANKLLKRVEAVVGEFEGRVHAKWLKVKKYESKLEESQKRRRQKALVIAEADLAEQDLEGTEQPN